MTKDFLQSGLESRWLEYRWLNLKDKLKKSNC